MKRTVLITNHKLSGRTGTEIQTRNLALALLQAGHRPIVYSQTHGPIVDALRARSIVVTDDINTITLPIDVIHGHHNSCTATAAVRFPHVPAIFLCQDFAQWHDYPPKLPNIRRYLATSEANFDRLTAEGGVCSTDSQLLLNCVDLDRCQAGPPLPDRPTRALLFAKGRSYVRAVQQACDNRGIALEVIGSAVDRLVADPEAHIRDAHLVFASGLGAMESIACGRAVVVCDPRGLAGFCSAADYPTYRRHNFGLRLLSKPLTVAAIEAEIDSYDPTSAMQVSASFRADGGFSHYVAQLEEIYDAVIAEHRASPVPQSAWHRAIADHLQRWGPTSSTAWPWMRERGALLSRIDSLECTLPSINAGAPYRFGSDEKADWYRLGGSWGRMEHNGMWTVGPHAWIRLRLPAPVRGATRLSVRVQPFLNAQNPERVVDIYANGVPVAEWRLTGITAGFRNEDIPLPPRAIQNDGDVLISLRVRDPIAIDATERSQRAFGVKLRELTLTA